MVKMLMAMIAAGTVSLTLAYPASAAQKQESPETRACRQQCELIKDGDPLTYENCHIKCTKQAEEAKKKTR